MSLYEATSLAPAVTAVAMLPAFAAGFRGLLAVLGEIARIVLRTTAAMAVLSALAAGFGCLFAILREVARIMFRTTAAVAMLTALAPSLRGLLAVLGEIARVAAVLTLCHSFPSLGSKERRTP